MNQLQYTDFKNHSKKYFDKIEKGSSFIILRKGKPIAKLIPIEEKINGWKRDNRKVKLKNNKTTLEYILQERSEK
jgi:prevent-host-death family protein